MAQNTMTTQPLIMHPFNSKAEMAKALAETMAAIITDYTSNTDAPMTVALAGGETPKPVYRLLSKMQLPWHRLQFIATDERITNDAKRSNEAMLQNILGKKAMICSLQQNTPAPTLHLALIGIGTDGHTASLFPNAMPPDTETNITKVSPTTTTEERLTLPLKSFTKTPHLLIAITGTQKLNLLTPPQPNLPITKLLTQRKLPTKLFHAPD